MEVCANKLPVSLHGQKRHHHCLLNKPVIPCLQASYLSLFVTLHQ